MADLSGFDSNKTYRGSVRSKEPYYYIMAHLDLTNVEVDLNENNICYLNKENNFNYLKDPTNYGGYYTIEENAVIGEVTVYTNPDVVYEDVENSIYFSVGGVYNPSISMAEVSPDTSMDIWGGPTGNQPGSISATQLKDAQICFYGSGPKEPDPITSHPSQTKKYLALMITDSAYTGTSSAKGKNVRVKPSAKHLARKPRVVGNNMTFESGRVFVVVKVYNRFR